MSDKNKELGNPLLSNQETIDFAKLKPPHITEAVDDQIAIVHQALNDVVSNELPCFDEMQKLFYEIEVLWSIWRIANQLHAVVNTPELREVILKNSPKLTQLLTGIQQNPILYRQLKRLLEDSSIQLTDTQKTLLKNNVRDFYLSGAELNENDKKVFLATQTQLAELAIKFEQNVLDATADFVLYVDDVTQLNGIPADIQASFFEAAKQAGKTGYQLTLQRPCYQAVLEYADDRSLREMLYHAYIIRASELGKKSHDNTPLINQRLQLLRKITTLLGFKSYAEVSLVTKMAENPAQAIQFLRDLAKKAYPFAQKDFEKLTIFAKETLHLNELMPWDMSYVAEKMRQKYYALSSQEVRQYFPIQKVLSGLFSLANQLYGITISLAKAPVWHEEVLFYEILDSSQQLMGHFYLDLYVRNHKREGAWMNGIQNRFVYQHILQKPVACIVCNFAQPIGGQPALLTHADVRVLFHEMGHALHHLLTQVDELGLSGIEAVEWDAVELPSQLMENFCWEWDVLQNMSEHIENKAPLPLALYQKMLKERYFQGAFTLMRQIELGLFDMLLHNAFDPIDDWMKLIDAVRKEVAVFKVPDYDRMMHSFLHIFAGGYAAGYYSYLWAEVLASDSYAAFEENKDWAIVGKRFWANILAVGGTRSTAVSFEAFRGRQPDLNFLLKNKGLITNDFSH